MKKFVFALGLMSIMTIVSCKKDTPVAPPELEPVDTPAPPPVPAAPEVEEEDGTSVSIGKDGVDVSSKDGDKKTNVKVSDGDAKIEIKK